MAFEKEFSLAFCMAYDKLFSERKVPLAACRRRDSFYAKDRSSGNEEIPMYSFLLAIIYAAFISLGLPDSLLGSAWPVMHEMLGVPVSWAGLVTMIISAGTIVSSLFSDRLTRKFGAGPVTAVSVLMTAAALFGFSVSNEFWMLCLWAVPYGLGAGAVDAALNNYVALHYSSRDMSWLHCFWGVGTIISPYIMSYSLTGRAWLAAGLPYCFLPAAVSYRSSVSQSAGLEKSAPFAAGGCQGDEGGCSERNSFTGRNSCGRRNSGGGEREISDASAGPPDTRGSDGFNRFFLLLCDGADRAALGQQLSGAVSRNRCVRRGQICFHVLYRDYGGTFPERFRGRPVWR